MTQHFIQAEPTSFRNYNHFYFQSLLIILSSRQLAITTLKSPTDSFPNPLIQYNLEQQEKKLKKKAKERWKISETCLNNIIKRPNWIFPWFHIPPFNSILFFRCTWHGSTLISFFFYIFTDFLLFIFMLYQNAHIYFFLTQFYRCLFHFEMDIYFSQFWFFYCFSGFKCSNAKRDGFSCIIWGVSINYVPDISNPHRHYDQILRMYQI